MGRILGTVADYGILCHFEHILTNYFKLSFWRNLSLEATVTPISTLGKIRAFCTHFFPIFWLIELEYGQNVVRIVWSPFTSLFSSLYNRK